MQEELELFDGVAQGKYTVGLGQLGLSFCEDCEDSGSMAMTALFRLLHRHGLSPREIGHLQVGTESGLDASKSLKTYLMPLLEGGGGDVEGSDCLQACYGGTAALLAAAAWVESSAWNGRLAVVLASDSAVYGPGRARATSGAGACAILVGPDAPLALEGPLRASHFANAYDFYKPSGLFPAVDGPLSVRCYLTGLDRCWERLGLKWMQGRASEAKGKMAPLSVEPLSLIRDVHHVVFHAPYHKLVRKAFARLVYLDACSQACSGGWEGAAHVVAEAADDAASACTLPEVVDTPSSTPTAGRCGSSEEPSQGMLPDGLSIRVDFGRMPGSSGGHGPPSAEASSLPQENSTCSSGRREDPVAGSQGEEENPLLSFVRGWSDSDEGSFHDRPPSTASSSSSFRHPCAPGEMHPALEREAVARSGPLFDRVVGPSTEVQRLCGNMYTASAWSGLAQLLESEGEALLHRRVLVFSYGSGAGSTLLSLVGREPVTERNALHFSLATLRSQSDIGARLAQRVPRTPLAFVRALARQESVFRVAGWESSEPPVQGLAPGTFYLLRVDERFRRIYGQRREVHEEGRA